MSFQDIKFAISPCWYSSLYESRKCDAWGCFWLFLIAEFSLQVSWKSINCFKSCKCNTQRHTA